MSNASKKKHSLIQKLINDWILCSHSLPTSGNVIIKLVVVFYKHSHSPKDIGVIAKLKEDINNKTIQIYLSKTDEILFCILDVTVVIFSFRILKHHKLIFKHIFELVRSLVITFLFMLMLIHIFLVRSLVIIAFLFMLMLIHTFLVRSLVIITFLFMLMLIHTFLVRSLVIIT
ncbi:hypothetical protein BCR32DRAFT_286230 [Anaeromyces robustus]|uniref:Uncharacterized protein n=1 Tax=Anaeromyces robustus TaxID=1754192 RepID=A0A1Y1W286_9FUNG|nr:hypothetical protein BCR32DRAFT_286230 [Anaeromyces robustus]|eukprot:ORX67356.1 hypothetical protein BCR32DRAFT_286230 [Anaeromyces robustus]